MLTTVTTVSLPLQEAPAWVNWIAQDSNGCWWGYSVEPLRNDSGWYENEVGACVRLGHSIPRDWAGSLQALQTSNGIASRQSRQGNTNGSLKTS